MALETLESSNQAAAEAKEASLANRIPWDAACGFDAKGGGAADWWKGLPIFFLRVPRDIFTLIYPKALFYFVRSLYEAEP